MWEASGLKEEKTILAKREKDPPLISPQDSPPFRGKSCSQKNEQGPAPSVKKGKGGFNTQKFYSKKSLLFMGYV